MCRGQHLSQGRATGIWRTASFWKLKHQDEKVHGEIGTTHGVEKLEPAAVESPKTHHIKWRMSGKARRQPERNRLNSMDWTEAISDCRAGREEKSKSVAERSREMVEKTGTAEVDAGTRL